MCNLHIKETEISQKRSKGIKNILYYLSISTYLSISINSLYIAHCYFEGVELTPKRGSKKKVQNKPILGVKFDPSFGD